MRKTLYIYEAPQSIPCWYCGGECHQFYDSRRDGKIDYECHRHDPLIIRVSCVQHNLEKPNWFFNRIIVQYDKFRLYWNFYSGPWVHLDHYVRNAMGSEEWKFISIQDWPPKWQTYPSEFLNQSPGKLLSFFRLYKVWS